MCHLHNVIHGRGTIKGTQIHYKLMPAKSAPGCILRITNIPESMSVDLLKADISAYGQICKWEEHISPHHIYIGFETTACATAAMCGLREHRRLVVDYACI